MDFTINRQVLARVQVLDFIHELQDQMDILHITTEELACKIEVEHDQVLRWLSGDEDFPAHVMFLLANGINMAQVILDESKFGNTCSDYGPRYNFFRLVKDKEPEFITQRTGNVLVAVTKQQYAQWSKWRISYEESITH